MSMPIEIQTILEKCNTAYSKGEVYSLEEYEVDVLKTTFDISVPSSQVDDFLYDNIYNAAKEKWPNAQFFNKLTSNNTGFGQDITHEIPMGSMEELKENDILKWKKGHNIFILSDKLDGCSLILTYKNGELKIAATRGHGTVGKDILRHIKYVENIPTKLFKCKQKIIVRGELLFKKNMIESILKDIELKTGKAQKNGRNTIAGALNRKDTAIDIFKNAKFVAYWTSLNQGISFELLEALGFDVPYYQYVSDEILNDENMIDYVKTRIKLSDYELDGIILTQVDNVETGFVGGTINPKCSRKFKLGIYDNIAESTVTNINWQISRWGVFTPVLEIEPVEVAGATITNITAHNYDNVIKTKCGIGAKIRFKRAGLVIPKLEEVLIPSEDFNLPNCKTKVNGVDLQYIWSEETEDFQTEMNIRKLEYFGSKLEIDQLAYGNCAKIYNYILNTENKRLEPYKIFGLPEGLIPTLIGKNGEKIEASLEAKKSTFTEVKFAAASGTFGPDIGERVLQLVWDRYGTLEGMTKEKLQDIDGFGEARIEQYLEYEHFWYMEKAHMQLFNYGITFIDNKIEQESDTCKSYNVCFSGIRDKDLMEYINRNGGKASDKWNKDVNYLVVKDVNATSSKIEKAKKSGCKILTISEMKDLINDN